MDYQETVQWLYNQLPFYQKDGNIAYKKNIDNVVSFFQKNVTPEETTFSL